MSDPRRPSATATSRSAPTTPFPSFSADPESWFRHVDELLAHAPRAVLDAAPETWTDVSGHDWRVVTTPDGPEVRPGLQGPFLRQGGLPRISALLVMPERVTVELSMHSWRAVATLDAGTVRVQHLGLAMLTGLELPHEGLDRLDSSVWNEAETRWRKLRSRQRVAIEVEDARPVR